MKEDILTVKDYVAIILSEDKRARNDDKWLVVKVLQRMGFNIYIPYNKLNEMPAFESITRAKRKFQEKGAFQANLNIMEKRQEQQEKMKDINKWWNE